MDPSTSAQVADLQQAVFNQRLWIAFMAVLAATSSLVSIIGTLRRKPPLDRELAEFRTRTDCIGIHAAAKEEHRKEHEAEAARDSAAHATLETRLTKGEDLFRCIERTLGRIEASIEDLKARRQ
jgi:uncharacterized protein YicC (UPF0701 family)